jgi:hypothetical protein
MKHVYARRLALGAGLVLAALAAFFAYLVNL